MWFPTPSSLLRQPFLFDSSNAPRYRVKPPALRHACSKHKYMYYVQLLSMLCQYLFDRLADKYEIAYFKLFLMPHLSELDLSASPCPSSGKENDRVS